MTCKQHVKGTNLQILNELEYTGAISKDRIGKLIIGKIEHNTFPYNHATGTITIDFDAIQLKNIFTTYNRNICQNKQLCASDIAKATKVIKSKMKKHKNYLTVLEAGVSNIATAFNKDQIYFSIWWVLKHDDKLLALSNNKYSG
jgi:hypothetical protein